MLNISSRIGLYFFRKFSTNFKYLLLKSINLENAATTTQTPTWKSMPSLNKTSAPPPMPLVGSCYPTRPEDIFVEQPFKQLKETFEQKSKHFLGDNLQAPVPPQPPQRSSSMSSVSSLSPASSTTNESVIVETAPTLVKTNSHGVTFC